MPSVFCSGGNGNGKPDTSPGGRSQPHGGARTARWDSSATPFGRRLGAGGLRGARSGRDIPEGGHRVAGDTSTLPRPKGRGCQPKARSSAERGPRWRRAGAPTSAPNAPGGPTRRVPSPTPEAAPTPSPAGTVRPREEPPAGAAAGSTQGGLAVEGRARGPSVGVHPAPPESPGRPGRGAVPPPTALTAAPSPTPGRHPAPPPRGPRSPR